MVDRQEIAAGWYPDPMDPAGRRWWDGTEWTGRRRAADGTTSSDALATSDVLPDVPAPPAAQATVVDAGLSPTFDVGSLPSAPADLSNLPPRPPGATAVQSASTAPSPPWPASGAAGRPVAGWWLSLVVAGLGLASMFLPTATVDSQTIYAFRDSASNEYRWELIWPAVISALVLVIGGVQGRRGRLGVFSAGAGAALLTAAVSLFTLAFVFELFLALDGADLVGDIDASANVGGVAALAWIVASIVLAILAFVTAFGSARGSVPAPLSFVTAGVAGYLSFVLIDSVVGTGAPVWSGSTWLDIGLGLLLGSFPAITVVVVLTRNAAASGIVAGFALPLAVVLVAAAETDGGAASFTDDAGAGLAIVALAALGLLGASRYDRQLLAGPPRGEQARPSPGLAIGAIALAVAGVPYVVASSNDGEDDFAVTSSDDIGFEDEVFDDSTDDFGDEIVFSTTDTIREGFHQVFTWQPDESGDYELSVTGFDGLDPTLAVLESGSQIAYNDDHDGTDPVLFLYLDRSTTYELVVDGYESSTGSFELNIRG